jgi:hypothetical protein
MTQDFYPRFTCLPASYVLGVAIHPLGGSRANWHHTPNPQSGATQPTQDGDPQAMSNPLEMPFANSHREGSRTPHNYHDRRRRQTPPSAQRSSLHQAI